MSGLVKQGSTFIDRRSMITGLAAILVSSPFLAAPALANVPENQLAICLYNPHTKEYLATIYKKDGVLIPEAYAEINHICRDWRAGKTSPMKIETLDVIAMAQASIGYREYWQLNSAYRTATTNIRVGGKPGSKHLRAEAVDITSPSLTARGLRQLLLPFMNEVIGNKRGGLKAYNSFVHLDTNGRF